MFWVIFDTSTKRDYYRDVHNLLALPPGGTIRYDYRKNILSDQAIRMAEQFGQPAPVLLLYAQDRDFKKGDPDHVGALARDGALWIGTRIATLRHVSRQVDRYYFDLEAGNYPNGDRTALMRVADSLIAKSEVPFSKWVSISDVDRDYEALCQGDISANWAGLIDLIGSPPSQFAGDSFWRISRITAGPKPASVVPTMTEATQLQGDRPLVAGVHAVYPAQELSQILFELETRMAGPDAEPTGSEPAVARTVTFAAPAEGPLAGLNERVVVLRRYATHRVEAEVGGTDRIKSVDVDVRLTTGPDAAGFPIGPELTLAVRVTKSPARAFFALLLAVLALIFGGVGAAYVKGSPEWGIPGIGLGALLGVVAFYLWTGKIKLPGASK